jgi:hypothetical protein
VVFVIVGFAFKVSAVPFHTWAPDTYEGAPTPVTCVPQCGVEGSRLRGAILMVYIAFPHATEVYRPFIWVLSALTMTIGNVVALKQTNIVRLLAYSSISQGGFILMPLVVAGSARSAEPRCGPSSCTSSSTPATNLGAFAVVIAVGARHEAARSRATAASSVRPRAHRADDHLPGLARGIPPLGGWYAKFGVFNAVLTARSGWGYSIAVIGAVNAVIATAYYVVGHARDVDEAGTRWRRRPVLVPGSIKAALAITAIAPWCSACFPASPVTAASPSSPVPSASDEVAAAIAAAGGAIRFDQFMRIALYGQQGLLHDWRPAGRRGDFITSPEVGRCSVRCWRAGSMPNGSASASPMTSPSSNAAPARHARPRGARRGTEWRDHTAVEVSDSSATSIPSGVQFAASCRRCRCHRRGRRQRTARQPSVSARRVRRRWREVMVSAAGTRASSRPRMAPDSGVGLVAGREQRTGHACRFTIRRREWVRVRASVASSRNCHGRSITCTPTTANWRLAVARLAAHLQRHGRGSHYLSDPATQDITAQVCLDQAAVAAGDRVAAEFLATLGDRRTGRGRARRWAAAAARPDVAALTMRSRTR